MALKKKKPQEIYLMRRQVVLLFSRGRKMGKIITLTTDFGLSDEYAGVMKGVMLSRAPAATIIDLCHSVPRQDIAQGALLIKSAYGFFPKGTIHVVVVDPGVGGDRRLILLLADGHMFLAPDNGVLSLLLESGIAAAVYEIQCSHYFLSPVSRTFHGRDILAPVAAHLAAGLDPAETGPLLNLRTLHKIPVAAPHIEAEQGKIAGKIMSRDNFGNLQTNIGKQSLKALWGKRDRGVKITVREKIIFGIKDSYAAAAPGSLLAIINSRGFLEIAVNQGDASVFLGAGPGDDVVLELVRTK
jgi:S-adenosylmethionine hydrolase